MWKLLRCACAAAACTGLVAGVGGSAQASDHDPGVAPQLTKAWATSSASTRLPAPKNIIYGNPGNGVNLAWDHIRGIKCYRVWIEKRTYAGPWRWWIARNDTIHLPWSYFPYRSGRQDQPYDFRVTTLPNCTGKADSRESKSGKVSAYLSVPKSEPRKPVNPGHETRTARRAWQRVVTNCNSRAGDVFLVTAGTGLAESLIVDWIPAVGEVAVGTVGTVALAASGVEYVTCFVQSSGHGSSTQRYGTRVAV